jgi:uncharacterized protein (TIGR04255 family)
VFEDLARLLHAAAAKRCGSRLPRLRMANVPMPHLRTPPIVEAVLDIDCDLPPAFNLAGLEVAARAAFVDRYPKFRPQVMQEHRVEMNVGALNTSTRQVVQALQFLQEDERQLVQIRVNGFAFNRLAPYATLDDYLPEIERTWRLYVGLVSPVQIRVVRLRYINRIVVPMPTPVIDLDEYLKIAPQLPDEANLMLYAFLIQQAALEKETGHHVTLVLTSQAPANEKLPIILDITVASNVNAEPDDWSTIKATIAALRTLKNRVFLNTLSDKCIELFQS